MCVGGGETNRLVHDTESHFAVASIFGGNLTPQARELGVSWPALSDDIAIPPGVIVDVDDAHLGTRAQAALHQIIVGGEVRGVEGTAQVVVDEVLPRDWQTESVEAVVGDEVVHLVDAGLAGWVGGGEGACSVCAAAEVEACGVGECDQSVSCKQYVSFNTHQLCLRRRKRQHQT